MVFSLLNKYPYTSLIFGIVILIALLEWYGFVKREQSFYEKTDLSFDEKLLNLMENYPWKGNVREMENKIERAVILADNNLISISEIDIVDGVFMEEATEEISVNDFEKIQIEKTLLKHNGNISKAAQELNLSRPALYRRMEKHNIKL